MRTDDRRAPRPGLVPAIRLAAIALLIALSTSGWVAMAGDSDGLVIGAEFDDASPLMPGMDVKVDGVVVGKVADMAVVDARDGDVGAKRARVTMQVEASALPVHQDASATVRASSLLGERYVDLRRGTESEPALEPGAILPAEQNAQATDLDQVLNTIDQPTGRALAELVVALGAGVDGNGENVDAMITALAPSMADTGQLTSVLREQNELLGSVVDRMQPVVSALASGSGADLDNLVDSASLLTAATAEQHRQLKGTLAQLPDTLAQARRTLGQLAGTAEQTTPTLQALRPTTDELRALSEELSDFSTVATQALSSAKPVLERAHELLVEARPVAAQLREASPDFRSVVGDGAPVVDALAGNIGDVLDYIRFWALTTNGHDGISHYFRAMLVISPEMVDAVAPQSTGESPQAEAAPQGGDDVLADLPSVRSSRGLIGPPDDDGGVTGLTAEQESDALRFLLGGGR